MGKGVSGHDLRALGNEDLRIFRDIDPGHGGNFAGRLTDNGII